MKTPDFNASCPLPIQQYPHVLMAHGGGGKLMHQLLENVFGSAFSNPILDNRHDSAQFDVPPGKLAMTTDSYVVRPLFFPGGDIGSLSVFGTANDLAVSGAHPRWLSRGLDFMVLATAIHTSRCSWVSVRQRAETVAKTPRTPV